MFIVHAESPFDDDWIERHNVIVKVAGEDHSRRRGSLDTQHHEWEIDDFISAVRLKNRLNGINKVRATVREK